MGKILISFLGAGHFDSLLSGKRREYNKTKYKYGSSEFETRFIADFLLEELKINRLYIFGTPKSMWEELYATFSGEKFEWDNYLLLNNYLTKSTKDSSIVEPDCIKMLEWCHWQGKQVIPKLIHYGLNDDELKINIEKILSICNSIDKDEEVYIDITHAFRTIPMYGLLLVFFLKKLKGLNVRDVYYGMNDVSRELGYTPVVSQGRMLEQFEWIDTISSFNNFGSTRGLVALLKGSGVSDNSILSLQTWAYSQQLNDNKKYKETSIQLVSHIDEILKKDEISEELRLVLPYIKDFPERIKSERYEWKRFFLLAKKNCLSDNVGLAIINLWEGVVNRFEEILGLKIHSLDDYILIGKIIRGSENKAFYMLDSRIDINFYKNSKLLSKLRNSVAHGEALEDIEYANLSQEVSKLINYFEKHLSKKMQIKDF